MIVLAMNVISWMTHKKDLVTQLMAQCMPILWAWEVQH